MTIQPNSSKSFEQLLQSGSSLLHQGRYGEAKEYLEVAYQLKPEDHRAAMNLSSAYILNGKFKQAVPILEALSDQSSDDAMVWINLGAAYLGNPVLATDQDQLAAIAAFTRAYAIDPVAPSVAYNIGLIYRDRHENERAISWFRKALAANPKDKDARGLLKRLKKKADDESTSGVKSS